MEFGKIITTESFFQGKISKKKTEYSIPKKVNDRSEALSEVLEAIKLITTTKTNKVTLVIESNPKTKNVSLITRIYSVDN